MAKSYTYGGIAKYYTGLTWQECSSTQFKAYVNSAWTNCPSNNFLIYRDDIWKSIRTDGSIAGGGGATPPSFLTTDGSTEAWYIYTEDVSIEVGVQRWVDQSGNNRDLTQFDSGRQPLFSLTDGIIFDSATDDMMYDGFVQAQPIVVYAVMKQPDFNDYTATFRFGDDPAVFHLSQGAPNSNGIVAGGAALSISDRPIDTWEVCRFVWNTSNSFAQALDSSTALRTIGTGSVNAQSTAYIRMGVNGAGFNVKEMIVRSMVDSSENNTLIFNYLNEKYSIY